MKTVIANRFIVLGKPIKRHQLFYPCQDTYNEQDSSVIWLTPTKLFLVGKDQQSEVETTFSPLFLDHFSGLPRYRFLIWDDTGHLWLVLDPIAGISLKDYYQDYGPIAFSRARSLLEKIAGVVAKLRGKGFPYRDLWPNIVYIDESHNSINCCCDVGLQIALYNRYMDTMEMTEDDYAGAHLQFLAPDFFYREIENSDEYTDVFNLGLLCCWLLAGCLPFLENQNEMNVINYIRRWKRIHSTEDYNWSPFSHLSDSVLKTISKAIAPSRIDRLESVDKFLALLYECGD